MRKSIKNWYPIKWIRNGIIKTKDNKYCKVIEVMPINFDLQSTAEQETVLYNYKNFLNNCDFDIQILVKSRCYELDTHINNLYKRMEIEENENVIEFIRNYIKMIKEEKIKVAISKKFFIVIKGREDIKKIEQIEKDLKEKILKIKNTLNRCGNVICELGDNEIIEELYTYMNINKSKIEPISLFFNNWREYEYKNKK